MIDPAIARANMVENQLRPNRIDDARVLRAMGEVPRERCVPDALRGCAYGDEDLAPRGGRPLTAPLALAKLLQTAAPAAGDVALVVGDITGYATAVLARLAGSVFCLLPPGEAQGPAEARLSETGATNIALAQGAPAGGLPQQAPFDLILLVGSIPTVPAALVEQLGAEGRLVGVGEHGRSGRVTLVRKVHGALGRVTPFDAQIHRMPGLAREPAFSF